MLEFNATFIIALLSFAVFIIIMNAIFYRPILEIVRKREQYINSNYENSKRFEADANEYLTTHAAKIEQTKEVCRHEFKSQVELVQNEASDKINSAKENSKLQMQNQKDALLNAENSLKAEIDKNVIYDLASSIASKVLGTKTEVKNSEVAR